MKTTFLIAVLCISHLAFSQNETSFTIGRKHYADENYAEAIKYLNQAAVEEPNNAQVPYFLGRTYLDMSEYKKSAEYMEKAITMDTTRANWIYELSLVYYAVPDDKKCLYYMELAGAKGYKRTNDYMENLANAYINVKQYEKGAEILKELSKKKPSDKEILYQTAQAYYNGKKFQEAIDTWDVLLGMDKTNADALYMIGLSYQKMGDKQKGQQLCDRAIEMNPALRSKRQQMGGNL